MEIDYSTPFYFKLREDWLTNVSRTFTLSIKILPYDLRDQVGLAYLICRFLDTLEDDPSLTVETKIESLNRAQEIISSPEKINEYEDYFKHLSNSRTMKEADANLLRESTHIFSYFHTYRKSVKKGISKWAIEMAEGMKKYCFGIDKPEFYIRNRDEFEEYTYYVAGTVGKMLSSLFLQHINDSNGKIGKVLEENDIQFGKALQYVNIIKDANTDILENRCFLPKDQMDQYSLNYDDLFKESGKDGVSSILKETIVKAEDYIENSMTYIKAIPMRNWRIRLFCIWPIFFAVKSLNKIKDNLDIVSSSNQKIKISRKDVKRTIFFSIPSGFFNLCLDTYYKALKR
ncbi:MAG: hypothetical protein CR982_09005 [Candidatus Cloacimonadota bacterium]|nr:MAG: hypothetical protein CR982_09005 [Candidatus Cloacimonadota bacterium]PIE78604.1 MAG: hypothetical protein CSA15_06900 [Candidatus Delongbacteria bacterium]